MLHRIDDAETSAVADDNAISSALSLVTTASGLSIEAAKTCVYYATATHGMQELPCFPILNVQGPMATGKTQAMRQVQGLVPFPHCTGTNLTEARLRDELVKAKNGVVFIEEADTVPEHLIACRFGRDTARGSVNRMSGPGQGWHPEPVDYFGATVLHKRRPFNDAATVSRAITIKTQRKPGIYELRPVGEAVRLGLRKVWDRAKHKMSEVELIGRAGDVWRPLFAVALFCDDKEWLEYAREELEKANQRLKMGQEFEPDQMVVHALIAASGEEYCRLVSLTEIRDHLRKEYNWQPSASAVAHMARDMGFAVKTSHGIQKVVVDKVVLTKAACQTGLRDLVGDIWGLTDLDDIVSGSKVGTHSDVSVRNLVD